MGRRAEQLVIDGELDDQTINSSTANHLMERGELPEP